jgi:AraC-like DNA-binding protein
LESKKNLIFGAFIMLLSEIECAKVFSHSVTNSTDRMLLKKCLDHIDGKFKEKISAPAIARAVGISESSLYSLFKKSLGISVHRYITEKRIMYAHEKIKDGALPTKIYPECGYNDYATFYKAYVSFFGKSPSENF